MAAKPRTRRDFVHLSRRMRRVKDRLAERSELELSVPLVLARNQPIPTGFLSLRGAPLKPSAQISRNRKALTRGLALRLRGRAPKVTDRGGAEQ
jgi:hypothetical protein